jgi:hypothetical protein
MKVFLYLPFHIITFESSNVEIESFWSSQRIFELNLGQIILNKTKNYLAKQLNNTTTQIVKCNLNIEQCTIYTKHLMTNLIL